LTGIKNNRIFAAASTTRQKVKKSMILRDFENSSLRQRTVNVLLRNRKSCSVQARKKEAKEKRKPNLATDEIV
jgi:hypothetical protein